MITFFIIVGFYAYFFYAKNFYKNRLNELKNQPLTSIRIKKLVAILIFIAIFQGLLLLIIEPSLVIIVNICPILICLLQLKILNIRIYMLRRKMYK